MGIYRVPLKFPEATEPQDAYKTFAEQEISLVGSMEYTLEDFSVGTKLPGTARLLTPEEAAPILEGVTLGLGDDMGQNAAWRNAAPLKRGQKPWFCGG
eukprot:Skav213218  [mRNA]  locus=scaffold2826:666673:667032:- [translate_table: standard]